MSICYSRVSVPPIGSGEARVHLFRRYSLKGISAEFQVIRGFSQKIPADLLSYNKIHS